MAKRAHTYRITTTWTGNKGEGTASYTAYSRAHELKGEGKPPIPASSDPAFRGDAARYNPEEMLLAALSACHMLWYLHLCASAGIVVSAYADRAEGEVAMNPDGSGQFARAVLKPEVTVESGDLEKARALHGKASALCFIARSVNFPVEHKPVVKRA